MTRGELKNFKEWLTVDNLKKLDEEINFGLTKDGAEVNVIDWLNQSSSEGIMNSIKVEPVSFYPNSTEEIMCSNNIISHAHNLTYGILRDTTEEQMKKIGLWGEGILGNKV